MFWSTLWITGFILYILYRVQYGIGERGKVELGGYGKNYGGEYSVAS